MRIIGLDVHRTFAEAVLLEGGRPRSLGRVSLTAGGVQAFTATLTPTDHIVLEATCNTYALVRALQPHVKRVAIANPLRTRLIAEARIKTDKVDAAILAHLYAAGFLPEVWMPDAPTEQLRRQVVRRASIVQHRTRLKNRIHAILHRNLLPCCPRSDLFGLGGRQWLGTQVMPDDERDTVNSLLNGLDQAAGELATLDRALAQVALEHEAALRLFTVPGVDATVSLSLVAAVGDITRFRSPQKLVSYLGLNPRVRQSGLKPASHGPISKHGRAHARGMLVEAAWVAAKSPGPLRAFFLRIRARRGEQIAAVATARKLAVLAWHLLTKGEDYTWARPALLQKKRRSLELRAGWPTRHGQRGRAHDYNLKEIRLRDRAIGEQAERAYQQLVAHWQPRRPRKKKCTGATTEARS